MSRKDEVYIPALEGKKIPILTMDEKWHQLFTQTEMTPEIRELAARLDEIVNRESQMRTEIKEIKRLKKQLLSEIVPLRDQASKVGDAASIEHEIQERTRLVNECNDKIDGYQDELQGISKEIYDADYDLMVETMNVCYDLMHDNTEEINGLDDWVRDIRIELKKNVIKMQEKEIENFNIYSYMHQIFGPEVIDIFDMKYDPEHRHPIRTLSSHSNVDRNNG